MSQRQPSAPTANSTVGSRRWKHALLVLAVLLLTGALALRWLLRPEHMIPAILDLAGEALGLEITARDVGEYRLRGTPQLIVSGVEAREKSAATPVLTAERVFISVPWSTLRARGRDLTAVRLELEAPVLDIDAFRTWQSHRPPSETRIPTLTSGLRIRRGRVQGDGWAFEEIALRIPHLAEHRPLRGQVTARYAGGGLRVPMDLAVNLRRLGGGGGLGIAGSAIPTGADWQLPTRLRLSAYLRTSPAWRLDNAVLGASARYRSGDVLQRFTLGLAGPLAFRDGLRLERAVLALRGQDAVPSLDARGDAHFGKDLRMRWQGQLAGWPEAWPALPPPLGQSASTLPFALEYQGPGDLSGIAGLRLQRDRTRFDGRFRLFQVMDWLNALDLPAGSPLPPLDGQLNAPRLEMSGAMLEGVEIRIDDPAVPASDSPR